MEIKVEVLIKAPELVNAINNLALALSKNKFDDSEPKPTTIPLASAPQYTIEEIMKAGATLMDAGKIQELRSLIKAFNVDAVTSLAPEQLGAFATELRKLGAQI